MNPSPMLRSWSRTCSRMLGTVALCAFMASFANGEVIGGYFGGTQRTDGGQVVGVSFNSFGATFSSLGFFDFGQDGLAASYQVGLWDSSQNLLASAIVTPSSPLIGDFRYASISPITIGTFANPQTFTIGALLPASMPDVWLQASGLILNVGFTGAGTGQFTPSGSLVYPDFIRQLALLRGQCWRPGPRAKHPGAVWLEPAGAGGGSNSVSVALSFV